MLSKLSELSELTEHSEHSEHLHNSSQFDLLHISEWGAHKDWYSIECFPETPSLTPSGDSKSQSTMTSQYALRLRAFWASPKIITTWLTPYLNKVPINIGSQCHDPCHYHWLLGFPQHSPTPETTGSHDPPWQLLTPVTHISNPQRDVCTVHATYISNSTSIKSTLHVL